MKSQNETPLYATLLYDVRKGLDVSVTEYFYLDMVHKLSYNRWCIKSLEHCAIDIGISKRGLIKLRDRLLDRGLLEKNRKGNLKVTLKYTDIAVNKVHQTQYAVVNKVPKSVNKVHPIGELSATKNNNRITLDNKGIKSKNKELIRQAIKSRNWDILKGTA